MSDYNKPVCADNIGNTGVPGCSFDPKNIVGAILIPKAKVFSDAELAAILTTLQTATLADALTRMYPVFKFVGLTDGSEDETVSTKGYGNKSVTREGKYDWTFEILGGGVCLQKKLRTFNGNKKYKVIFFTSDKYLIGTQDVNGDLTGIEYDDIYAKPFKLNDGSNDTMYHIRFMLSKPEELNDTAFVLKLDFDPENNVKGLLDLELYELAAEAGTSTIGVRTACDKVSIYDTFADELASPTLWTATKAGADVTITGVVKNDTLGGWDVSHTGSGAHVYGLVSPALLAAADVGGAPDNGYEAGTVTITVPAS